ncbi:MAG: hypothetical protein ACK5G7_05660 [Erysipelotrichaceae bacterium]
MNKIKAVAIRIIIGSIIIGVGTIISAFNLSNRLFINITELNCDQKVEIASYKYNCDNIIGSIMLM